MPGNLPDLGELSIGDFEALAGITQGGDLQVGGCTNRAPGTTGLGHRRQRRQGAAGVGKCRDVGRAGPVFEHCLATALVVGRCLGFDRSQFGAVQFCLA